MDLQQLFNNAIVAKRSEEMKTSSQLTVGELILKLENIDKKLPLYFDNKKYRPTSIGSWRGSYCELSINFKGGDCINSEEIEETIELRDGPYNCYKSIDTNFSKNVKVEDLLKILKVAVGKTMTGYKGGNYLIGKTTPVWVSTYGTSNGYKTNENYDPQAIVDVKIVGKKAILVTELIPY